MKRLTLLLAAALLLCLPAAAEGWSLSLIHIFGLRAHIFRDAVRFAADDEYEALPHFRPLVKVRAVERRGEHLSLIHI